MIIVFALFQQSIPSTLVSNIFISNINAITIVFFVASSNGGGGVNAVIFVTPHFRESSTIFPFLFDITLSLLNKINATSVVNSYTDKSVSVLVILCKSLYFAVAGYKALTLTSTLISYVSAVVSHFHRGIFIILSLPFLIKIGADDTNPPSRE